jgi:SAM-dependent methyltransferase
MSASLSGLRDWRRRVYAFNEHNRREWLARHAARVPSGSRVLDVGAGSGQYRPLFAHCDYKTHDFGQEPGTIGKYVKLDYQSDITAIPVDAGTFDVVICTEVLEHVPKPIEAVRELARVLRPGGSLFMTAPLASFLHQEPFHFYGGYTPHWYRKFLPEAGFAVDEIVPNQGFFSLLGQELQRFRYHLRPDRTACLALLPRAGTALLWVASWPVVAVFPPFARWLDTLHLDATATVGYHVKATRLG